MAKERSGAPEDKANYVSLMANMRSYFHSTGHNYGISLTLPSSYWYLQHFDLVGLQSHIDWFNMMSYDLHGTWDADSVYVGPKVAAHTNRKRWPGSLPSTPDHMTRTSDLTFDLLPIYQSLRSTKLSSCSGVTTSTPRR